MNKILSWFYHFKPVRLVWWWVKKRRGYEFNDRETIQYLVDHTAHVFLPNEVYHIDHTTYLNSRTTLEGTYHTSKPKAKENVEVDDVEIVCSECGKQTTIPEKNKDGIFYKFFRCNCGHETELNPSGSFIVTHKGRET